MYCSKCGAKVDEQAKFCQSCGSPILNTTVPTTQEATIPTNAKDTAVPVKTVSDKWIWSLAVIPMLVGIIVGIFTVSNGSNELIPSTCFLIFSAIFMALDIDEVNKSLQDNSNVVIHVILVLILGVILVPFYLFRRESRTNKNYVPGIIWCVLFGISVFCAVTM